MIRCAVILAGGFGTRLSPLGDPRPKPLMPINNQPLLQIHLQRLADAGVEDVRVSVHYGADLMENALRRMDHCGMKVESVGEEQPLGTAGAIRHCWNFSGQDAYVLNGDITTDFPLKKLGETHEASGADASLWGIRVADVSRYGVIEIEADSRIRRFVEKPSPGQSSGNVVSAGAYVLTRRVVDLIPEGRPMSIEKETFPLALQRGLFLRALVHPAYWMDIGTPQSYLRANLDCNGGQSILGPGCRVPPSAVVEASVLLEGCELGEGAEVRRSLLGRFCRLKKGARVEDQVLAEGSHV